LISFWGVAPARIYLPRKACRGRLEARDVEIQSKVRVWVFRNMDFATHEGRARARCPTLEKFKRRTMRRLWQSSIKYRYYMKDNSS